MHTKYIGRRSGENKKNSSVGLTCQLLGSKTTTSQVQLSVAKSTGASSILREGLVVSRSAYSGKGAMPEASVVLLSVVQGSSSLLTERNTQQHDASTTA